jgi:hypothetical protein
MAFSTQSRYLILVFRYEENKVKIPTYLICASAGGLAKVAQLHRPCPHPACHVRLDPDKV